MAQTEEENKGIALLKKGQKGILHAIFSRFGLILLLFLVQVFILFGILRWFGKFLPHIMGGTIIFSAVMVTYLLNSKINPAAKITWLIVIMLLPVFGVLLFSYTQSNIGHRALKARMHQIISGSKEEIVQSSAVMERFTEENQGAAALAYYMKRSGCHPVYEKTAVTYFPVGEDKFAEMLKQLEAAEHFIFMEYFIVDEGLMWGKFWMCWHGLFGLVLEGFGCLIQHGRWENHMIFIWEPLCGIYGYGAAGCCIGAILLKKLPLFDCFVLLSELYCRFRQEPCSTAPKVL